MRPRSHNLYANIQSHSVARHIAHVLAGAFLALVAPTSAHSLTQYTVCPNGCTTPKLQTAIDSLLGPDVEILVSAGTYRLNNEVDIDEKGGTDGHPAILRANGQVILDCSDDFSTPGLWTQHDGDVYKAYRDSNSTRVPQSQVFVDDVRYRFMGGSNFNDLNSGEWGYDKPTETIYVNVGAGNPGWHAVFIGNWKRQYGIQVTRSDHLIIDGFTVLRASEYGVFVQGDSIARIFHSPTESRCRLGPTYTLPVALRTVFPRTLHSLGRPGADFAPWRPLPSRPRG